ncbi:MAG: CPBP family glutamic-type intramembrane protease, partial [Acidobacteriota bacterium]
GTWVPPKLDFELEPLALAIGAILLVVVGLELTFRGLVHGILIPRAWIQTVRGRWFLSLPTIVAAVLYAVATTLATWFWTQPEPVQVQELLGITRLPVFLGALLAGVALGMIRERSTSLLAAIGAALAAALVRILFGV